MKEKEKKYSESPENTIEEIKKVSVHYQRHVILIAIQFIHLFIERVFGDRKKERPCFLS